MKTLIIGCEPQVIKDVTLCLKIRYRDLIIIEAKDGLNGIELLKTESPDIVFAGSSIIDIPIVDLVHKIHASSDSALVILHEGWNELRLFELLEAGADEFITKDFSVVEFLAKIGALLRRTKRPGFKPHRLISIGNNLVLNQSLREVTRSGERLRLTSAEYRLLSILVKNEGKTVTYRTLLGKRGNQGKDDINALAKHISRLRRKIEVGSDKMIFSERGAGYKFVNTFRSLSGFPQQE